MGSRNVWIAVLLELIPAYVLVNKNYPSQGIGQLEILSLIAK